MEVRFCKSGEIRSIIENVPVGSYRAERRSGLSGTRNNCPRSVPCSCDKSILTSRAVTSSLPNCFPSLVSYAPDHHNTLEVPIQTRKLREHRVSLVLLLYTLQCRSIVHIQGLLSLLGQSMRAPLAPHCTKEAARTYKFLRAGGGGKEKEKKKVAWPHVLAVCMSRLAPAFRPFSCSSLRRTFFLHPPTTPIIVHHPPLLPLHSTSNDT